MLDRRRSITVLDHRRSITVARSLTLDHRRSITVAGSSILGYRRSIQITRRYPMYTFVHYRAYRPVTVS